VALLDAESRPVATTVPGFVTDWRKPFVASEVGEILPHWEVAAYFLNPAEIASSARASEWLKWMLVPILLGAIGFGSVVIIRDVGKEMHAARQKTDFVSNVSHELKTPLTSIRMFSDLLEKKDDVESDKMRHYAGIISTEAARLTRLINNLLDFSRMERGEKKYDLADFDAADLASEVVENYRLQIESEGLDLTYSDQIGAPVKVCGDRDALAQVLLNLISNAEKYGASGGEIVVEARRSESDDGFVELRVMDRGPGVSRRESGRVFEKFYRVDDSLSTGIQGSGLGLTLARQIARGHGGDVECCKRDDGKCGGCFSLRLPVAKSGAILSEME
jgi:signal transduction histidine kinase